MSVLIDFSNMYYRYVFGNRDIKIHPELLHHYIHSAILDLKRKFSVTKKNPMYVVLDCPKKDSWKFKYYNENKYQFEEYQDKEYKGQRVKDDTMPWDDIYKHLEEIVLVLKNYTDIRVIMHPQAEADDTIYVLTVNDFYKTVIVSTDKDFIQLLKTNCVIYHPIKDVFIKYDEPDKHKMEHILTGDKSDNILPCRHRLGAVKAKKMYSEGIIEEELRKDSKFRKRFLFNKKLIDLSEIPDTIQNEINTMVETYEGGKYTPIELIKYFSKYSLRELGKRISEFGVT